MRAGILQRAYYADQHVYEFKHALIQRAAYDSLLKKNQRLLHNRLAEALEERISSGAGIQADLVAQHFNAAQVWERAVPYWLKASQESLRRSANREAIAHSRAGLAALRQLPDGPQAQAQELALLSCLGPALIAITGFASDEVGEVYARARELSARFQEQRDFFPSLWGSWVFHLVRGELDVSRGFAESMVRLGQRTGDDQILVEGHWTLGDALYWQGHLAEADGQLRQATDLYDRARHHVNAYRFGQDPGVAAWCYRSFVAWMRGQPTEAASAVDRARELAHDLAQEHVQDAGQIRKTAGEADVGDVGDPGLAWRLDLRPLSRLG